MPTAINIPTELQKDFPGGAAYDEREESFMAEVTAHRKALGLPPLVYNEKLMLAAQLQADWMLRTSTVSAQREPGDSYNDFMQRADAMGYDGAMVEGYVADYPRGTALTGTEMFNLKNKPGSLLIGMVEDTEYVDFGVSITDSTPSYLCFNLGTPRTPAGAVVQKPPVQQPPVQQPVQQPVQTGTAGAWHPISEGETVDCSSRGGKMVVLPPGTLVSADRQQILLPNGTRLGLAQYCDTVSQDNATTTNTSSTDNTNTNNTNANTTNTNAAVVPPACSDPRVPDDIEANLPSLNNCGCMSFDREAQLACDELRQRTALYLNSRGCPSNVTPRIFW